MTSTSDLGLWTSNSPQPEAFQTLTHALERHRSSSLDQDARPTIIPLTSLAPTSLSPGPSLPASLPDSPELSPSHTRAHTHDVPGEVFIDRHETAGLPGRDVEQYAQAQAERVLRAHKRNFFLRSRHGRRSSSSERPKSKSKNQSDPESPADGKNKGKNPLRSFFKEFTSGAGADVEKSAEARLASKDLDRGRRPAGTGVLGTLLSIYEPASAMQSGATTPAREYESYDEAESRPTSPGPYPYNGAVSMSASSSAAMMPPPPVPQSHSSSNNNNTHNNHTHNYKTTVYPSGTTSSSSTASLRPPTHPWTRTPFFGESRPPKTRSGAGVFGPLIAGAGNIAGPAAPTAVTVAPDLKRPGYHLSRCVLVLRFLWFFLGRLRCSPDNQYHISPSHNAHR